jgi:hypothetical protein
MTKTVSGIVHGKTIDLEEDLGVPDGQAVEVQVKVVAGGSRGVDDIHKPRPKPTPVDSEDVPAWCNVLEGMSDEDLAHFDEVLKTPVRLANPAA